MYLSDPEGAETIVSAPVQGAQTHLEMGILNPQLWWPNGMGEQPLYQVDLLLSFGPQILDRWSFNIGLRTLELCRQPDKWVESFTFVVNGVLFLQRVRIGSPLTPLQPVLQRRNLSISSRVQPQST
jgi:beta-mannosidase